MAENGGRGEECCVLDIEKKFERLTRGREHRMSKIKEKLDDGHLPTPPPDPWTNPVYLQNVQGQPETINPRCLEEEEDIIAYLADLSTPMFEGQASECPSRNSATSNMAVATLCTEEAFEHLDRLYALTEQVLELRDRNSRFFKRVRDLEKLKALRNAERSLERAFSKGESVIRDFPEEDTGFAESLLDAMLSNCRDHQVQSRNNRSPSSRRRSRSLALSEQSTPLLSLNVNRPDGEKRVPQNETTSGAPKVSKWTRVKAAFKWERACTNDTVETVDPTTTTPSTPTTKYLRIPEVGSGNWSGSTLSPSTSEVSGPSTPVGRVSSASSSNEGSYDGPRKNTSRHSNRQSVKIRENGKRNATNRRSRSLDGDIIMTDASNGGETSEGSQGRPVIRITSDNNPVAHSLNTGSTKITESSSKRPTPTLTITIPSNEEELRSISSPESISPLLPSSQNSGGNSPQYTKTQESSTSKEFKRQQLVVEEPTTPAPKMQRQDSKWNKVRRAFLTNATFSVPPSPIRTASGQSFLHEGTGTPKAHSCSGSIEDLEKNALASGIQSDTRRDYQALREKLGAEFHRKLVEWERLKGVQTRVNARSTSSGLGYREGQRMYEDRLAPEFKRKLQDWKRAKKGRRASASVEQQQRFSRRRLTDWQLWRSPSKPEARNQDTIGSRGSCGSGGSAGSTASDNRPHLCEDFVRRMESWRRMNEATYRAGEGAKSRVANRLPPGTLDETEFVPLEKVLATFGDRVEKERRESDARQLDECFDGDLRFLDGAQGMNCGNEILIRTSVGSYRFEGISREFTRKLYDWEKYRGISPRSSTFRLLGPGYTPFARGINIEESMEAATTSEAADEGKTFLGVLKRSKSVGSMIEGTMRNNSFIRRSTSLQSLNHLANTLDNDDRTDQSPAPMDSQRNEDASEDAIMDDSEPEAMIVDIEDVIEETASPLNRVQPHQTPVYSVAASETTSIAVPLGTVTSSHEPSPVFLVEAEENSDSQQWESMAWNQRKNYSSEGSQSPEHFDFSAMWNSQDNSLAEDKPVIDNWTPWNRQDKCFVSDSVEEEKNPMVSEELPPSPDWREQETRTSPCEMKNTELVDCDKDENPTVSLNDSRKNIVKKSILTEAVEPGYVRATLIFGDPCKTAAAVADSMDTLSESEKDGDRDQEEIGSSDEKKDIVRNETTKSIGVEQEAHPMDLIISPSPVAEEPKTIIFRKNSTTSSTSCKNSYSHKTVHKSDTMFHGKQEEEGLVKNRGEHYGVITHEAHVDYSEVSNIKAELTDYLSSVSSIEDQSDNAYENCNCVSTNQKYIGDTVKKESGKYWSFDKTSVTSAKSAVASIDTPNYRQDPTLQTTPITVTSCQQPRCFERLIINEETLNKIVVPTACTSNSTKRSIINNTDSIAKDYSHECNRRTNHDNNRATEDHRNQVVRKIDSPTKNVFVKTKRIIFSPFRRAEERLVSRKDSEDSDVESVLRPKCKSKSRSASPKISRQDALLRVPLSLPWPLRSGSKDRDVKLDRKSVDPPGPQCSEKILVEKRCKAPNSAEGTSLKEARRTLGVNVCSNTSAYSNRPVSCIPERKLSIGSETAGKSNINQSFSSHDRQCGSAIALSSTSSDNRTSTQTCPSSSTSPGFDPLSSDLMHKLRILSNVAARRDGRTNTISTDRISESHSARIRRAKESFFSSSGGPFYGSARDSFGNMPEINTRCFESLKDIRETTKEKDPPKEEDEAVGITSDDQEEEEKLKAETQLSLNENRLADSRTSFRSTEASTGSLSDLVKSASAGMINVDPDTFGRLATSNRGCESLPRTITKRRETSGPFARIVNKFKLSRLIRGKESEASGMSTISTLCRQSLLIDVRTDFEEHRENEEQNDREDRLQEEDKDDVDFSDDKK